MSSDELRWTQMDSNWLRWAEMGSPSNGRWLPIMVHVRHFRPAGLCFCASYIPPTSSCNALADSHSLGAVGTNWWVDICPQGQSGVHKWVHWGQRKRHWLLCSVPGRIFLRNAPAACVCVLVIVWDGHCSVCAATGMETALSETHDPRVGRPFQHAREYFPPAMFHFQSDFCCLDGSFSIRFVFSRSLWIKRPIGFWLEGEASPIYFSLTSQNTGHTIV